MLKVFKPLYHAKNYVYQYNRHRPTCSSDRKGDQNQYYPTELHN